MGSVFLTVIENTNNGEMNTYMEEVLFSNLLVQFKRF